MSENKEDFLCDECKNGFYIGQGFLGSLEDFEFKISDKQNKEIEEQKQFECSPFTNYVQLCNSCYSKK